MQLHDEQETGGPLRRSRRLTRWGAALIGCALLLSLTSVARSYLRRWEAEYVDLFAPTAEDDVVKGLSMTRTALSRPDKLLLFGSSELTFQDEYHPARLFANQATGFGTFIVGSGYRQNIHNMLVTSSLGSDMREKRIVLFVTPTWFDRNMSARGYRKNYSALQAYETVFTAPLSDGLKQRASKRLLAIGGPVMEDPLVAFMLQAKATGGPLGKIKSAALWPVGRTYLEWLRMQDEIRVARLILRTRGKKRAKAIQKVAPAVNDKEWAALAARAEADAQAQSRNNRFGIQDDYYLKYVAPRLERSKGASSGESWLDSAEYDDLQLLLDALHELKAKPLFISVPVSGAWYDFREHPRAAREQYYARVRTQIKQAGFPVVDFGPMEYEPGFMRDPWHPGWKGSVMIAQTIDRFYHDQLADAQP